MARESDLMKRQPARPPLRSAPTPTPTPLQSLEGETAKNKAAASPAPAPEEPSAAATPPPPSGIEYKVLRRETLIPEEDLNALGRDGWELLTALPVPHQMGEQSVFTFKRKRGQL